MLISWEVEGAGSGSDKGGKQHVHTLIKSNGWLMQRQIQDLIKHQDTELLPKYLTVFIQ